MLLLISEASNLRRWLVKTLHLPYLEFSEASLYKGNVGIWKGEIPRGSTDMLFLLRGGAERGVTQLLPKLASFVPVLFLLLH